MLLALLAFTAAAGEAQNTGGIDAEMLGRLRDSYKYTAQDKALRNALAGTDIQKLAANADVSAEVDGYFSHGYLPRVLPTSSRRAVAGSSRG